MIKERSEKEIRNLDLELEKCFSIELLAPHANKNDSNRLNMFNNHILQSVVLCNPEKNCVTTKYQNMIGDISSSYRKAERDYIVKEKIKINSLNYIYILEDIETSFKDIVKVEETINFTESYGSKLINEILKYNKGDKIEKGTLLYRSTAYDEYNNLMLGTNLNLCYLSCYGATLEDGIIISESASEKLAHYNVEEYTIPLNNNDVLLNLYGDNKVYKAFPDIGEDIKDGVLLASRRILNNNFLNEFAEGKITNYNKKDTVYYSNGGKVVSVEVFSNNKEIFENDDKPFLNQIKKYYLESKFSETNLIKYMNSYINEKELNLDNYSEDLIYNYKIALVKNQDNIKYEYNNKNFDNLLIKIKVLKKIPATVGSKITNLYAGKGVVSMIIPDEDMPINQFGQRAEIIVNPMGLPNRMNFGQSFCHELMYISENIVLEYKMGKLDYEKYKEKILKFHKMINLDYYNFLCSLENLDEYLKEEVNVLGYSQLYQGPASDNIDINDLKLLEKEFKFEPSICTIKGVKLENPLKIAKSYYITLKHHPKGKYSVRSTGSLNLEDMPSKSKEHKNHKIPFSNSPIKLGNMEVNNLLISNKFDEVSRYIKMTSTNPEFRKKVIETILLSDNPMILDKIDMEEDLNQIKEKFKVLLNNLGLELKQEYFED